MAALVALGGLVLPQSRAAESLPTYYAHNTVEDAHGVIAPWHKGQNGQWDERLRIGAELYKRYPWVDTDKAVMAAPHIIYNTHWKITDDGTIIIPPTHPWMCGDLSQRSLSIIQGLSKYYRYSGDPLAFVYIPLTVDYILDYCLTPPDHPWPSFPVSTPTKGIGYQRANPDVANQLDLCAYVGVEVLRAYKFTGTKRYLEAAQRWGETIATKCNFDKPDLPPWSRYVSPQYLLWSDELTGGVTLIVEFLDALIDMGFTGKDNIVVKARDRGRAYLTDDLLPRWTENEVWGRHYWDMEGALLCGVLPWICEYFMDHPEAFPLWKTDVRNLMSLAFNRNCVDPASRGEAYSGAWAIPESSICCRTSLSYNQYTYAPTFMMYGERADDEWAREIGRRMLLMATYDSRETGVVLDGLAGEVVEAGNWLNLAHPWPFCQIMKAMEIDPEACGPSRENHIMSSTSVVTSVVYDKGRIEYETFDAPENCEAVLRLAFSPTSVTVGGKALSRRTDLKQNGYTVKEIAGGDRLLTIRHDGCKRVVVDGPDPQEVVDDDALAYTGSWQPTTRQGARGGSLHVTSEAGATMKFAFTGNQVRLIGSVDTAGGLADVFVDGARQLTLIDCWNPAPRDQQLLYSRSGLSDGKHTLKIVARGKGNLISKGSAVCVDAVQYSAAKGETGFGEGGGPVEPQRMIFGYTGRQDYVDSQGNAWRPGTEFVIRLGHGADSVVRALCTERRSVYIGGTADPELYRYGLHGQDFRINLTVGPGRYSARLLFADTNVGGAMRAWINGQEAVEQLTVREAAGGKFKAFDLTFPDIRPASGMIEIRLAASGKSEACIQALEVVPYDGKETRLIYRFAKQLLVNDNFEADLKDVPNEFQYISKAPSRWHFVLSESNDHGIQNIVPFGGGKVGAWLSTGDGVYQAARHYPIRDGERYRVHARVRGKGKEGVAGSASAGNRIGVTMYWVRGADKPFDGQEGRDWGVAAEASVVPESDGVWHDLQAEYLGKAEHAGRRLVVKGWYQREKGTSDSYVYFDKITLLRAAGLAPVE
ncbi:MAG: hypothetical protein JXQ73_28245 [Phycisphaerae bacterium]|nr:hypothetical protein [Phycisphaerae bacterium]